jgi:hypothetical protein
LRLLVSLHGTWSMHIDLFLALQTGP